MTDVTPLQAIARAHNQSLHGPQYPVGMCLQATRRLYDVAARYGDAATAWANTRHRIPVAAGAPAGALVWWTGGSHGHGHVALATGDGYCWSVDIRRPGYFDRVPIEVIAREWGLRLAGYSRDLNGVQVLPDPVKPSPHLDHAIHDLRTSRSKAGPRKRRRLTAVIKAIRAIRGH